MKTTIASLLTLLLFLALAASASAANSQTPTTRDALRVAKSLAPPPAIINETATTVANTRHLVVEFNQSDFTAGQTSPRNGIEILVGRNVELKRNWVIASYFVDGSLLIARGGLVGDEINWSLTDASGNPITTDSESVIRVSEAFLSSGVLDGSGQAVASGAAATGPGLATGIALNRIAATYSRMCKGFLGRLECSNLGFVRGIVKAFFYSFPKWDYLRVGLNVIDCRYHAIGTGRSTRMYLGYSWFKAYYRSQFVSPMPAVLASGAYKVTRLAACVQ